MTSTTPSDAVDGRYVLESVIGRGGMAEVRRATDARLGRSVAVKLLQESLAAEPEARSRFADEARAAARLTDPNVVAIYDTGEHHGRPYIVMELLPGPTLRDEMDRGPLREDRVREVVVDVLRALRAAHSAGVIHRDIKPANILLTSSGGVKVADFGIAKVAESTDMTATGFLLGTPSYLAPECVSGHAATAASDLYAVGVILYEALSGRRPFVGATSLAVCHAIVAEDAPSLRDLRLPVSDGMISVVERAMAKDPSGRYRAAEDMIAAIGADAAPQGMADDDATQLIETEPTQFLATGPTVRAVAVPAEVVSHRKRARIATVAVGSAAVLAAVAAFAIGSRAAEPSTNAPAATTAPRVTVGATVPTTTVPITTAPVTTPKKKPGHGHGKPPKPGAP